LLETDRILKTAKQNAPATCLLILLLTLSSRVCLLSDVFLFIEALADGGVRAGLPRPIALQLAAQTVKGAATMCLQSGLHPGVLKDQVCE